MDGCIPSHIRSVIKSGAVWTGFVSKHTRTHAASLPRPPAALPALVGQEERLARPQTHHLVNTALRVCASVCVWGGGLSA